MGKRLLTLGLKQLFGGLRRGNPAMAGLGAALTFAGWLRREKRGKELLYRRDLRQGETIRIRLVRGEAVVDEAEIGG